MKRQSDKQADIAYIGIGSNIGQREHWLEQAVMSLDEHPAIEVTRCSSVYETEPIGYVDQPDFLNMVVEIATELEPYELLQACMDMERKLGRERRVHWGPRTIDLDVLLFGDRRMSSEELTLPHPRMDERLFVLIPLMEIMSQQSAYFEFLKQRLETMEGKDGVFLWKPTYWQSGSGLFAN